MIDHERLVARRERLEELIQETARLWQADPPPSLKLSRSTRAEMHSIALGLTLPSEHPLIPFLCAAVTQLATAWEWQVVNEPGDEPRCHLIRLRGQR